MDELKVEEQIQQRALFIGKIQEKDGIPGLMISKTTLDTYKTRSTSKSNLAKSEKLIVI